MVKCFHPLRGISCVRFLSAIAHASDLDLSIPSMSSRLLCISASSQGCVELSGRVVHFGKSLHCLKQASSTWHEYLITMHLKKLRLDYIVFSV